MTVVHCYGSRKSAINGILMDIKEINWVLTYEKGVLRPFNKLLENTLLVYILENIFLMFSTFPFNLKLLLKKIVLNKFRSWTCIIYYWLLTPCWRTWNKSPKMKLMNLSQSLESSIYPRNVYKNSIEAALTEELPTWKSIPIL